MADRIVNRGVDAGASEVSPRDVVPLDNENAKVLRFIEVFEAEDIDASIDVVQINAKGDADTVPPPF